MCNWGEHEDVTVTVPAELSHTGSDRKAVKNIDRCIASLVTALNKYGIETVASCCGHGRCDGVIVLRDGRELIVKNSTPD